VSDYRSVKIYASDHAAIKRYSEQTGRSMASLIKQALKRTHWKIEKEEVK